MRTTKSGGASVTSMNVRRLETPFDSRSDGTRGPFESPRRARGWMDAHRDVGIDGGKFAATIEVKSPSVSHHYTQIGRQAGTQRVKREDERQMP